MADEETKAKILNQVEFYFSDSNLLNDKFLFTTQSANDGWVPIQTISQFERMKKYRPVEVIVEALKSSAELLEVSENGELVRRKSPLPKNYNEIQMGINKRSIVAEKLPEEATLDELLKFFNTLAPVNQVRMKKTKGKNKKFLGVCTVEFKKQEDAEKVIADIESTPIKYTGDIELAVVSKVNYDESKARKFGARKGGRGRRGSKSEEKDEDKKRDESPKREEKKEEIRERD
ncbi:Lhp1 protein [Martiniozyma asiatica (nom. inval.)]|nr:Lhp1 protein [Martiniozyma asiatica]